MKMTSINTKLEDVNSKSSEDSLSMAPYNNFNSLTAEDSVEQIRKRNTDVHSHITVSDSAKPVARGYMSKEYCYKLIDIVAVVAVIAVLWLIMALPTVVYICHTVDKIMEDQRSQMTIDRKASNNSNNINTCEHALYDKNGSTLLCKGYLQSYTNCLKGSDSVNAAPDVYVSSPFQQTQTEEKIQSFLYLPTLVGISVRPQCDSSLKPFACLYFIHLCDNGTDIGPSEEQCKHVSNVCDQELKQIKGLNLRLPIPVDEYLSNCASESPFDNKNCNITGNGYIVSTHNCRAGFYQNLMGNGSCLPECNVWSPFPHNMVLITDILNCFSAIVCILSGIAVLVLSWLRRPKLYRYPSIFIIYQTVLAIVLSILVLVGVSARKRLFCGSRSLIESVRSPTRFCLITGIALYYIVMQLLLWWLWHTIAVFWGIVWPFHAKKFNRSKNTKYLHLGFILASLILPVVPVVIVIFASSKRGGFTITRAPPILCAGYDLHTNFWAFMFPLNILLAVGVTLMVFILRVVIKNHCLSKIHKIKVNLNWVVETKVLIVLCYYILLGAVVLSIFTTALLRININELKSYFSCEAKGLPPPNANSSGCEKQLKSISSSDNPILISLAIVILGFLPVVNLVYVIKFSELKSKIKTYSQTRYVHYVQKEAEKSAASRYVPYNQHRDTTLQCDSMTLHDNTFHTEPLLTSQMNNDLRN